MLITITISLERVTAKMSPPRALLPDVRAARPSPAAAALPPRGPAITPPPSRRRHPPAGHHRGRPPSRPPGSNSGRRRPALGATAAQAKAATGIRPYAICPPRPGSRRAAVHPLPLAATTPTCSRTRTIAAGMATRASSRRSAAAGRAGRRAARRRSTLDASSSGGRYRPCGWGITSARSPRRMITARWSTCTAPLVVPFVTLLEANVGAMRSVVLPLLRVLLEPVRRVLVRSQGGGGLFCRRGWKWRGAGGGGMRAGRRGAEHGGEGAATIATTDGSGAAATAASRRRWRSGGVGVHGTTAAASDVRRNNNSSSLG